MTNSGGEMARDIRIRYNPRISEGAHGTFTAICEELGIAASGDSAAEARSRLRAVVGSLCSALQRLGMLERALAESGIRFEEVARPHEEDVVMVAR